MHQKNLGNDKVYVIHYFTADETYFSAHACVKILIQLRKTLQNRYFLEVCSFQILLKSEYPVNADL